MGYFAAILLVLIGVAFVIFRWAYARFIMSFLYGIPAIRQREACVLQWIRLVTVIAACIFMLLGLLVALTTASIAAPLK